MGSILRDDIPNLAIVGIPGINRTATFALGVEHVVGPVGVGVVEFISSALEVQYVPALSVMPFRRSGSGTLWEGVVADEFMDKVLVVPEDGVAALG